MLCGNILKHNFFSEKNQHVKMHQMKAYVLSQTLPTPIIAVNWPYRVRSVHHWSYKMEAWLIRSLLFHCSSLNN